MLIQAETEHHDIYLEYCRIRHFRIRWERETSEERKNVETLKDEMASLRESANHLAEDIAEMERRLPVQRNRLADIAATITEKEKANNSASQRLSKIETALQEAFDSGPDANRRRFGLDTTCTEK